MGKTEYFQYVKLGMGDRRYFCLHQNILILTWILFFNKGTLQQIVRSLPDSVSHHIKSFQQTYRLLKNKSKIKLKMIIMFIGYKYYSKNNESTIELPIYGQICVPVHKGYKVFDIRRGVVVKIFNNEVEKSAVSSEIKELEKVSIFNCAPSIRRYSIDEKWYEEDYCEGSLDSSYAPMETNVLLKKFHCAIVPCLEEFLTRQEVKSVALGDYLNDMKSRFEDMMLSTKQIDPGTTDKILPFFHFIWNKFNAEKDYPVVLVCSHGDFNPANMINTKKGVKVIDWEGVSYRSALFDFYSYCFYRPICRDIDIGQMSKEMNEVYIFFISRLSFSVPVIYESIIGSKDMYRRLYYIERICMLIERLKTDTHENLKWIVLKHIKAFRRYEEMTQAERVPEDRKRFDNAAITNINS